MDVSTKLETIYLKPYPNPLTGEPQKIADPMEDTRYRGKHREYVCINSQEVQASGLMEKGGYRVQPQHVVVEFENGVAKVDPGMAERLIDQGTAIRERPAYVSDPEYQGLLAEASAGAAH